MEDKIIIKGARVHNLKNIFLEIPKNKLIVFTGVSGSGKSSLAFDTIFAEGQRRYIESLSPYIRQFLGKMDKPNVDEILGLSPAIAIDQRALSHNPRSTVGTLTEIYDYLRIFFARIGKTYCPICNKLIEKLSLDEIVDLILNKAKLENKNYIFILSPVVRGRKGEYYQLLYDYLNLGYQEAIIDNNLYSLHERINLSRYSNHDIKIIIDKLDIFDKSRLTEAVELSLNYSKGLVEIYFANKIDELIDINNLILFSNLWTCPNDNFTFSEIEPRFFSFNSPYGACDRCHGLGKENIFLNKICSKCLGKRLKKESLSVKINNFNIYELTEFSINKLFKFFIDFESKMTQKEKIISKDILKEIKERLKFLIDVGLDYLNLKREAETLSGGEAQRIRLASQIGSQLSNTLYVLDEPTIGLHERDTERLIKTLINLRNKNNTLIVVEHDESVILTSDFLVDLGPLAGKLGGQVMVSGETKKIINDKKYKSLTLKFLRGEEKIEIPKRRLKKTEFLKIINAKVNNLKNINVNIPLRKLVGISGVSGSGKSTLIYDVLYKNLLKIKNRITELEGVKNILGSEYIEKVIMVDQSPIGRTPRSNPATYTGIFTPIRDFFASLQEAKAKGFKASRFSFNVSGGRCEACQGSGNKLIEMHFLPPVLIECEVCRGKRFNRETLSVKYKNKNISDVLNLTINEAYNFFENIYFIVDKLKVLIEIGLGYLKLGQSATTLSGGEAQRIKLARELIQPFNKRILYLLDEPSVGLHYYDIKLLLKVLNKLVDRGNSVILIEHNMHILKSVDYIIDLGPEGGINGGKIIAFGLPEEIIKQKKSYTGQFLKRYL